MSPHIPPDIASAIVRHVRATGAPLLRASNATDLHTVLAWSTSDDGYQLSLEDEDEAVQGLDTWGEMADYLGLSFPELLAALERRRYPSQYLAEDPDEELADPYDVFDVLKDLQPWPAWDILLADVPSEFVWETERREQQHLGTVSRSVGARPGDDTEYVDVDCAEALSCLQYVFDTLGRHAHIRLAD